MTEDTTPSSATPASLDGLGRDDCGAFGISIDRDGTWYYQGSPIRRLPLVKLFATVLWRDDDGTHWMTTPVENGTVEVEDVAFVAVEMQVEGAGADTALRFRTNLDDWVTVDADHPLRVHHDPDTGEPSPYVYVRKGLEARLSRSVYYELVALALEGKGPPPPEDLSPDVVGIWSQGHFWPIGEAPQDA